MSKDQLSVPKVIDFLTTPYTLWFARNGSTHNTRGGFFSIAPIIQKWLNQGNDIDLGNQCCPMQGHYLLDLQCQSSSNPFIHK